MRIARTRGATAGMVLILLGAWGGIVPFIGPYFNYSIGPTDSWHWTTGRLWLSVLPGIVAIVGGLMLLASRSRATTSLGAMLGIAAGAWFIGGPVVSELWNHGVSQAGALHGPNGTRVVAQIGYHLGVGAVILFFASAALGRLSVRTARDELVAAEASGAGDASARRRGTTAPLAPAADTAGTPGTAVPRPRAPIPPATPPATEDPTVVDPAAADRPVTRP